jgi:hypothetical protein
MTAIANPSGTGLLAGNSVVCVIPNNMREPAVALQHLQFHPTTFPHNSFDFVLKTLNGL